MDFKIQLTLDSLDSAELCEALIHYLSEKDMRLARNAYNRSNDMSEEIAELHNNNMDPVCVCRDTSSDTPRGSTRDDPDKWEYGDGDQSPMDQKVWMSKFGKLTVNFSRPLPM